jgi:hypothetical protein
VVGEEDMVVWVLGCQDEKIEWGMGYFTLNRRCCPHAISIARPSKPRAGDMEGVWWVRGIRYFGSWDARMKKLSKGWGTPPSNHLYMMTPCKRYRPPIKTKDSGRRGSVQGEGDMVVRVLGCRDKEIERGVGYLTLKSPMTSSRNRYRPPTETKDGGRRGSALGEGDRIVRVLECRDEEIEQGVGYSTLKSPMTLPRKRYRPPIKTKDRERRGSVLGEGRYGSLGPGMPG